MDAPRVKWLRWMLRALFVRFLVFKVVPRRFSLLRNQVKVPWMSQWKIPPPSSARVVYRSLHFHRNSVRRCWDFSVVISSYIKRIICQICLFQQAEIVDISTKWSTSSGFSFLNWNRNTVCVGWESAVHHLVMHANEHKQSSLSIIKKKEKLLLVIVSCLSFNPPVLIPLLPPPLDMTYFYPPLFTLSFNLVTLWSVQQSLETDVISCAPFTNMCERIRGRACVPSCCYPSMNQDKDNPIWTPGSLRLLLLHLVFSTLCLLASSSP